MRVFPVLNINKRERWGSFCSVLFGVGLRGEVDVPLHLYGEQGTICELATVPTCDMLVNRMFCLSSGPLQTGVWEPQASHTYLYPAARCKYSSRLHTEQSWTWYPRDACPHPSILMQLVTIGNLLGECLSWDWTGLLDLSVGCLCKVCSCCGGL